MKELTEYEKRQLLNEIIKENRISYFTYGIALGILIGVMISILVLGE